MVSSEAKKGIFAHTFLYSAGNFLSRGLNFILLPIYSHYISPSDFGVYSVIISVVTIASTILNLGLPSIFVKNLSEYEELETKRKFLSNVISGISIISVPIFFIVVFLSKSLSRIIIGNESYSLEIILGLLSIYALNYSYYFSAFFIAEQNSKKFVLINSISAIVNFFLNLFLIIVLKLGINGIFISQILSSLVLVFFSRDVIKSFFKYEVDFNYLKPILITSLPLLLSGIFTIVVELIDRIIVLKILGEEQAGIYSFGYRIALIYNLFILSFKSAWIPHYFQLKDIDEIEKSRHLGRVFTKLVFVSAMIILAIQFMIKILFEIGSNSFQIFDKSYEASQEFIVYIMLGYFFSLLMAFYSIAPYKFEKTIHFLFADLFAMLTNLILNFLLIEALGVIGAAIATMLAFMIGAIYLSIYNHQKIMIRYEYSKLILILIISIFAFLTLELFNNVLTFCSSIFALIVLGIRFNVISKNLKNVFTINS